MLRSALRWRSLFLIETEGDGELKSPGFCLHIPPRDRSCGYFPISADDIPSGSLRPFLDGDGKKTEERSVVDGRLTGVDRDGLSFFQQQFQQQWSGMCEAQISDSRCVNELRDCTTTTTTTTLIGHNKPV